MTKADYDRGRPGEDKVYELLLDNSISTQRRYWAEQAPTIDTKQDGIIYRDPLPDILAAKSGKSIFVEVKTKERMTYHPAQGFDTADYHSYQRVQQATGITVYVLFVDGEDIYGNKLDELKVYKTFGGITTFCLNSMLPMEVLLRGAF